MISFFRKYKFIIIAVAYLALFIMGNAEDDGEVVASLLAFLLTITLILSWLFVQIKSIIRLKNEKTKTELLHLKSQISPHFFFNMLNNLYGLIEKNPKKAGKLVLKLSDMMRYSIYEGQKDWVTLVDEVEYLNGFIELHKMRYHKKIEVKFDHNIQEEKYSLMPLLFVILLENAFKHGVENLTENAYIHIDLSASKNEINFAVENNFDKDQLSDQQGIGLKNLKRRLELVYPKRHSLSFSVLENVYKAHLTLNI